MKGLFRLLLTALLGLFAASAVHAQVDYVYSVYVDADMNGATGCTVTGPGGATMPGVDMRIQTDVGGTPPRVTAARYAQCAGGTFGTAFPLPANYPVGLNNGVNGADVIEMALSRVNQQIESTIRVGFGARTQSGSEDVLFTTDGSLNGAPIIFGLPAHLIPLFKPWQLMLLAGLLAGMALWTLHRHPNVARVLMVCSGLGLAYAAYAASFQVDGQVSDWAGRTPQGSDPTNDAVPPQTASDLVAGFIAEEAGVIFFRLDVVDAENQPPVATPDSYSTLEDTPLTVPAPGVLGNDSDPDGDAITAVLAAGPTRGTLVLNPDGSFTYTPTANLNGPDSFTYRASDGQATSAVPALVTLSVTAVNDAPSFTVGADQTVLEDAAPQSVANWATAITDGDPEATQNLTFVVTNNSNAALFATAPAISPTGTLSYTPAANANGTATISVRLDDDGGTANGGLNQSAVQTFVINVTAVNDAPVFTAGANQTVLEDAGAQTVAGWATGIGDGDPELTQTLTFQTTVSGTTGNLAFSAAPAVDPTTGTLTYAATANTAGVATVQVRLSDNGSNVAPNVNISAPQTFTITVTGVNDAPVFTAGPNQTVNEDAGAQTVAGWATGIDDGDGDVVQVLNFNVTNDNNALFSTQPAVSPTGTLSYTPAANANGTTLVSVRLLDDGGTASGGVNQSAIQTFTITVTAVNDAPSYTAGANQTVNEDAGPQIVNPWATAISAGPADESGQTLGFNITGNTNAALFATAPAVSPTGVLTYTPAADASGVASLTLILSDNGSNTPPNVNTSAPQTFTITVNAINDAPINTVPAAQATGDVTPLVFSTANTNALSIADVDVAAGLLQLTLSTGAVGNGTLTLSNPGGVLATLTGNGTETVIATGTLTNLNLALNGPAGSLTYTPVIGTSATRTLSVTTSDQGNTGAGGAQTDTDTVTINVDAAPVVSATPAAGLIANDASFVINFSEPVDVIAGITLTCGGPNLFTGGTTGTGVTTLSPTYTAPLPAGPCVLTVPPASVSDTDTIDPPNNPTAVFTRNYTVDAAPVFVSATPAAASVVAANATVSFTYDEPVNGTATAITVDCGGPITGTLGGSGTATLTFTPAANLPFGSSCTATAVAAQITDVDSADPPQNPSGNTVRNFSVDAEPAVTGGTPANGATNVATNTAVSFTFSENVDATAGAITLNCGGNIAGVLAGSGSGTLTFTPSAALPANTACTATAVAANINDSDTLDPPDALPANVSRSFTTDAAPAVTTTSPVNGSINAPINGAITVNFSEPVNFTGASFTLECPAATPRAFTVSGSGTATATLTPSANLPINTLCNVVVIATGIDDLDAGDPPANLAANFNFSFTTVNDNPPSVSTVEVEIGNVFTALPLAVGQASDSNTQIRVTFSEAVTASGVWGQMLCTISGSRTVGSGLAVTDSDPVFVLTPSVNLAPGDACTLTVFAVQVVDDDAIDPPDQMTANFVTNFNVDRAPTVTSSVPANGDSNVALNSTLTVNFSENVDVTAGGFGLACSSGPALTLTPSTLANANTVVLTPSAALPATATCTLTVASANVTDSDLADPPNGMLANYTASFTTVDPAPSVTTTNPVNGGALPASSDILINFSENVNFTGTSFALECPVATAIPFTVSGSGSNLATLNPTGNLPVGPNCTVTVIATGISDVDAVDPPDNMAANFVFSFTPTNSPPVLTAGATLNYTENQPAQTIDNTITVSDADSANLASATAQITGNYANGEDVLACPGACGGLTASFAAGSGTLSLSGSATLATYEAVLRTVTYVNTSENPSALTRTVTWIGNDGIAGSAPVTSTINVTAVNDAPVVVAGGTAAYTEDGPAAIIDAALTVTDAESNNITGATISITTGFSSAQGDTLNFVNGGGISGTYVAGTGVLTLTGSTTVAAYQAALRSITFSNTTQAPSAARTIQWVVDDGAASTPVTSTVNITAVNDPPVNNVPAAQNVNEDATLTFNSGNGNLISITDVDVGAGSLQVQLTATNGTLSLSGIGGLAFTLGDGTADPTMTFTGTLTSVNTALSGMSYVPTINYFGPAALTIVSDDQGNTGTGGALSDSDTITITVNPVNDPPVAGNDAFDFVGNTELRVDLAAGTTPAALEATVGTVGVLGNDSDPVEGDTVNVTQLTVGACTDSSAPFDCSDPAVGRVMLSTTGQFSFFPAAADAGATETFTYQVSDTGVPAPASATGSVTLTRFERVWYVQNNSAAGGNGTSATPFDTLAEAETASLANDYIFVYFGNGTTGGHTAGIALKNGQRLWGEHFGLSLPVNLNGNGAPINLVTAVANNRPLITNSAANGNAVRIVANTANGNRNGVEVRGLSLSGNATAGNAIDVLVNDSATLQTLLIDDNVVTGAGAEGIDIALDNAGSVINSLALNNNSVTATGIGIDITHGTANGTNAITSFANNSISGNTVGTGVRIQGFNAGNPITFDASTATAGFQTVSAGTTTVGVSGNGVGAAGMLLDQVAGDLSFTDLDAFADAGAALTVNGTGVVNTGAGTGMRLTVGAGVSTLQATAGAALNLSALTADLQGAALTSTNSTGSGVALTNVADGTTTATVSGSVASSITNATGADFLIDGGNATVSYAGTITDATGTVLSVANTTADTKTFTGAIGSGVVSLTNNTGATISIRGGLALSTGASAAFSATGGGTIEVCDENPCNPGATGALVNTLTTSTGTALNVANTTLSANNLEFRSISSNGAVNGIVLNTTGSLGGLQVKGNSAGICGGTVGVGPPAAPAAVTSPVVADCTGGTIQASTGPGVLLTATSSVSLTRMQITGGGDDGVRGTNVSGFSLISSFINNNGNAIHESGLDFGDTSSLTPDGLHGTAVVTNSTIQNSYYNGLSVRNNGGAPLTALTITGSQFRAAAANGDANDSLFMESIGTADMAMTATGSFFASVEGDHIQAAAANSGDLNVVLTNNTLTGGHGTPLGQGITINAATGVPGWNGTVAYDINGNNINNAVSNGVTVAMGTSAASASFIGRVRNNVIGSGGVSLSCSSQANGVYIDSRGNGTHTSAVTGNTIRQCFDRGILAEAGDGDSVVNLTIQSNLIDQQVDVNAREALQTNFGITSTNVFGNVDTNNVCLQFGGAGALGNVLSHGGGAPDDFRLRKRFEATVRLPGYAGGTGQDAGSLAQVVAFIQGLNTGSAGEPGSASASGAGGGYTGGAACTLPP